MVIKQTLLREKASRYYRTKSATVHNFSTSRRKAFLCHSHKDKDLVEGLVVLLEEQGIDLYVDWKDHSMPEITNTETASKIQQRIKDSDVFLFLATNDSMKSRWCPWEIGYGDACDKKIIIIPTSNGYNEFGNEYLSLYAKIDDGTFKKDGSFGYFITEANEKTAYSIQSKL